MNICSYVFYRHPRSEYEQPAAGAGRGNFFRGYIRSLVRAHHSVFPDWQLWIHHDDAVREFPEFALLTQYEKAGLVKLIPFGLAVKLTSAMLLRLKPCFEPTAERVLCRDIDSLPQPRERVAVERWIASGKPVHALHDSQSHMGTMLLGGMCGFVAAYVRERFLSWDTIKHYMEVSGIDFDVKGGDQIFLNSIFPESDCLNETVSGETWDRDRNYCEGYARCVGGAYFAQQTADWYDRCGYTDKRILECESQERPEV